MPVIALDGRGNRGLIKDGRTGYFLPIDSTHQLFASKIEMFLVNKEKLQHMGIEAQKFSEEFDIEDYTQKLLDVYSI